MCILRQGDSFLFVFISCSMVCNCFVLASFTEKLTFHFRNVYHMSFKICKGNTKGRRRGGRGAVPAPNKIPNKNRCTLRRRVSPFSLPLGFPSALSFLTHPHPAPIFANPHRKSSLKLLLPTVLKTLIIFSFSRCAQPSAIGCRE